MYNMYKILLHRYLVYSGIHKKYFIPTNNMRSICVLVASLLLASTYAKIDGIRASSVITEVEGDAEVSVWGYFYNLLHCPPLDHHCHKHGSSGGGSSGSGSGGSGGYDDDDDSAPCDPSNDNGCNTDNTPVTTSNDLSSFQAQSIAAQFVEVTAAAAFAAAAVAFVLHKSRGSAKAVSKSALIEDDSANASSESGLVGDRLKSFKEFMRSRTVEPTEHGFEMSGGSSNVNFVRVEA